MELYGAFDLHSNNNSLGIIDSNDKRIYKNKLPNDPQTILTTLEPYKDNLEGFVVESTYNWYWLVDLLMDNDYKVYLANPSAVQKYKGLKHNNDNHDAFWLSHLLRPEILPEGYIYPKNERPIRDLLRKRGHLVRLRTSLILSLQGIISRNCGLKINANQIEVIKDNRIAPLLAGNDDLELSGYVSKEVIDFLTQKIRKLETAIKNKVKLKKPFVQLQTICGVGNILSLTIMLETGSIDRFPKVGNYVSYCREVPAVRSSNGKTKGKGNKKNGNRYLAWAFSEAAELDRRFDENARAWYNRKSAKTNFMVAHSAFFHKLARASYYVMKNGVPFDHRKLFS